jgi:uncharacterized protein (TIGR02996 family)
MPDRPLDTALLAVTEADLPFVRAILASPTDFRPRLAYADWLQGSDERRAEYIRAWVVMTERANSGQPVEQYATRVAELHHQVNRHWTGFITCWKTRDEVDPAEQVMPGGLGVSDAKLSLGPCVICGRSKNMAHWVSRLSCDRCDRVLCWECADTGIYGSLPDFRHFVAGSFKHGGYRLGSDSCPFCQEMDWMRKHGG